MAGRDPLGGPYSCGGRGCRGEHRLPLYNPSGHCPDTAPVRESARRPFLLPWGVPSEDPYSSSTYAADPYEGDPLREGDEDWDWEG